ncbi:MAG: bifunctional phosphopantothenoylcysteine decarboxylase/phosphopantothenate--cysteine ligase CoaBC [Oceanospirillaceae bacterium]|jgi:phosphopantothenoylcysteine decarboxylase/phosphopantothenate--cysteine ligase|nr:bifunctional phosphopantothenoylcysteine decarboxylase/phosphopantothenate--cysteine ligase CoaBC [Oceanospirillaceae bacterium]MBT6076840.1 bifunctional phosphopantothenoylcysteine decarboxylase/phosphopantothenate--cysteine ligase CoaBC [Oceanospirillaceae bacterium]
MGRLFNKHIIVAISGGIAAYKSAELVRLLKKSGAQVQVVMTSGATEFITPLTLQALSGNAVHQHLLNPEAEAGMGHIQLARWADALLIAPTTANVMARLAQGQADDLLTTLCLATQAPVLLAPAMNQAMWTDSATQANLQILAQRGYQVCGPAEGEQACGDVGAGRMLEPSQLLHALDKQFEQGLLNGKKVVITAGPTREAIDPVRYISNHSSGKMGYALAAAARDQGAQVILISGPTHIAVPTDVTLVAVESAQQMLAASLEACLGADYFIASAAVSDYRPAQAAEQKLKKYNADHGLNIALIQNPDILATMAQTFPNTTHIGFAAETQQLITHAQTKLKAKAVQMIIANDVSDPSIGFNSDDNRVSLVTADGVDELPLLSKPALARRLIDAICKLSPH